MQPNQLPKGSRLLKKGFLPVMLFSLLLVLPLFPIAQGSTRNFVRVWEASAPEQNPNVLITRPLREVKQSTAYFDGLGRPSQTVVKQGSLSGGNSRDLVSPVVYDAFGREAQKYLSYVSPSADPAQYGLFKDNALLEQNAFYIGTTSPVTGQGEDFFYSKTNFEPSPLNRVSETYAPGKNWAGSEGRATPHSVKTKYWINTAADAVRVWNVTDVSNNFGTYSSSGTYPAGELYKNATEDERGKQVIEFKDKEGRVIFKKVQLADNAYDDGSTGKNHVGWLCTYYIYDDLGQLRAVLQPKGVAAIDPLQTQGANWTLTPTQLGELCFRYEYDQRGRMILKKVPGAAAVQMVYDARDRLVMTQDGNLRATRKWLVTVYDVLNRPVFTYKILDSSTTADPAIDPLNAVYAASHRSAAANSTAYPDLSLYNRKELLTETHYDNYAGIPKGFYTVATFPSGFPAYLDAPASDYPDPLTVSSAVKGMVTWTKTKVIGEDKYIITCTLYDEKGRVQQVQTQNYTGVMDVVTNQYSFSGQLLRSHTKHQRDIPVKQTYEVATRNNHDDLGRVTGIQKNINNSGWTTISALTYDALGQLKFKKIDPAYNSHAGLETLAYDYNIRGWLLGANRDYAKTSSTSNYFGFDLGYDKQAIAPTVGASLGNYTQASYNGNIAGMVWKSKGDGEIRRFDFAYDNVNRLTGADFNQYFSTTWNKIDPQDGTNKIDFSVSNLTYDQNGNILSQDQMGWKIGGSVFIDRLRYTYQPSGNKLQNVIDLSNDATTRLGDFRTSTLHSSATAKTNYAANPALVDPTTITDYTYDANGNLTRDFNKDIRALGEAEGIEYNHLNLPQRIWVRSTTGIKGYIDYTYDAAGNKLKKVTVENSTTVRYNNTDYTTKITTTTLYIGGFVYESKEYSEPALASLKYTDQLQFLAQEEGRIRPKRDASNAITGFVYDYMLKDHLGNVRMVLTNEAKVDKYPVASLESPKIATEQKYYNINTAQVVNGSTVNGLPFYTNDNGIGNNPSDSGFEQGNSQRLYRLNSNAAKTGLGITLKVMAGDRIDIFGKSYYFQNNTGGAGANSPVPVLDVLTEMLGAPGGVVASGAHEAVSATQLSTIATTKSGISGLFTSQTSNNNQNTQKPKAFINYLFFDERFKCVGSGFSAVGGNSELKDHHAELQNIAVPKNGYVYIYCSNESPVDVFFDNLQVTHIRSPLLEETHYYPFGLAMAGISSKTAGGVENKKNKYNGYELNSDFNLNLYESFYRTHDPQIGRFWQVDPKPSFDESLYAAMGNNPIRNFDILGDTVKSSNAASRASILQWIAQGLNLKKGQTNPFSFNKKGILTVNRSRLKKLSSDQKDVAGNVVKAINATENAVVSLVDKDRVVDRQPVDPKGIYLKITGYDKEGKPIFERDLDPGAVTPAGSGGGVTLERDAANNVTNIFVQRQANTETVTGQNGRQISDPNFLILFHEAFGHFVYRDVTKPSMGDDQKWKTIDYENQVRKLNNMPLRSYDDGHPKQ